MFINVISFEKFAFFHDFDHKTKVVQQIQDRKGQSGGTVTFWEKEKNDA